jgi:serine/threonine-protein kinase HipA
MRQALVLYDGQACGQLSESDDGVFSFAYSSDYLASSHAHPVSLTLPLRSEAYLSKTLFPFFDGLIPEGWLLSLASATFKLPIADRMGLLLATGKDPIGAVSVEALPHE